MTTRRQGLLIAAPAVEPTRVVDDGNQNVNPQRIAVGEVDFGKTPRCPAFDSGIEAPGIRHSAACKRRFQAFQQSLESPVRQAHVDDGRSHVVPVEDIGRGIPDPPVEDVTFPRVEGEREYRNSTKRPPRY